MTEAWKDEQYEAVSSAYITMLQLDTTSGKSLMCRINNSGPRIEPWGTPAEVASGDF